jgi:hypothetical protein
MFLGCKVSQSLVHRDRGEDISPTKFLSISFSISGSIYVFAKPQG